MLNQSPPMLKRVPLTQMIQLMIQMLIDLPARTILDEKPPKHAETTHPKDLARHACVLCTLPLSEARVATGAFGVGKDTGAAAGVHRGGLLDDEAVADELADRLA